MRNKLVNVARVDADTLCVFGILDDDIYSLELNVSINMTAMEIVAITGKWNRWTTPECPRALPELQGAVGLCIDTDFTDTVRKTIGRRACRHFANLLLECCFTAKEAALLLKWEASRAPEDNRGFGEFHQRQEPKAAQSPPPTVRVQDVVSSGTEATSAGKSPANTADGCIIDLHVHTSPASPCSSAGADQLIREALHIGLDGICLTDHNYLWSHAEVEDLRQKHGFLVLHGNEITTDQGDMIVFGLHEPVQGIIKLAELKPRVQAANGFIIVAHPFRGFLTFNVGQLGLTPEKAMQRPLFGLIDAVEVLNSKVTQAENSFAAKVATGLGLPATGGSDAHEAAEVGIYATRFTRTIQNEKDLIDALQEGDYTPEAFRSGAFGKTALT